MVKKKTRSHTKKSSKRNKFVKKVFKSFKNINDYYEHEKEKAFDFIKRLEKQRIKDHIILVNKNIEIVKSKLHDLKELEQNLKNHILDLEEKIKHLNKVKTSEKKASEKIATLLNSVDSLHNATRRVENLRKDLLKKEKQLVNENRKKIIAAKEYLSKADMNAVKKIAKTLAERELFIDKTVSMIKSELNRTVDEEQLLNFINEKLNQKLSVLNKKIDKVNDEKRLVMERLHSLQLSFNEASKKLQSLESKKKQFLADYAKLLQELKKKR